MDVITLEKHMADFRRTTGKSPKRFVCPITLKDSEGVLCNGHILNAALVSASRATVIQRADVDNYFGHTIEPEAVKWLNWAVNSPEDLIRQAKQLTITGP